MYLYPSCTLSLQLGPIPGTTSFTLKEEAAMSSEIGIVMQYYMSIWTQQRFLTVFFGPYRQILSFYINTFTTKSGNWPLSESTIPMRNQMVAHNIKANPEHI